MTAKGNRLSGDPALPNVNRWNSHQLNWWNWNKTGTANQATNLSVQHFSCLVFRTVHQIGGQNYSFFFSIQFTNNWVDCFFQIIVSEPWCFDRGKQYWYWEDISRYWEDIWGKPTSQLMCDHVHTSLKWFSKATHEKKSYPLCAKLCSRFVEETKNKIWSFVLIELTNLLGTKVIYAL